MSLESLPHLAKFAVVYGVFLYLPILTCVLTPVLTPVLIVSAQGPQPTPTPYPIIATRQAQANEQLATAQAQQAQADQLDQQAAAMRRNAEVQQAQAQQAINDARAASAAQNAAAVGEAIGRAEALLNQLRDTNAGQATLLDEASATIRTQSAQNISATNSGLTCSTSLIIAQDVNAAQAQTLKVAQKESDNISPVLLIVVVGVVAIGGVLLSVILSRKGQTVYADPAPVLDVAYDVGDYRSEDEIIEGG